jgi:hypothetical protein
MIKMKTAATLARIAFEASVQDAGPTASRAVAEAAAAYRLSLPAARLAALDAELGRQDLAGHIGSWAEPASPAPRPALAAVGAVEGNRLAAGASPRPGPLRASRLRSTLNRARRKDQPGPRGLLYPDSLNLQLMIS